MNFAPPVACDLFVLRCHLEPVALFAARLGSRQDGRSRGICIFLFCYCAVMPSATKRPFVSQPTGRHQRNRSPDTSSAPKERKTVAQRERWEYPAARSAYRSRCRFRELSVPLPKPLRAKSQAQAPRYSFRAIGNAAPSLCSFFLADSNSSARLICCQDRLRIGAAA